MTRQQLSIAGTDPARDPDIDEVLFPWLNAKQEKIDAGKREKNHHASLMVRLREKKIAKYPYDDPDTGKRRFIYPEEKITVKTSKAPSERKGRGRRRKASETDENENSDAGDAKPASASTPPEVSDPFGGTRAKLREGERERSVLEEARARQFAAGDPAAQEQAERETKELEQRGKSRSTARKGARPGRGKAKPDKGRR